MPQRTSLTFIFLVVLIDMLGFGIVMPVLPQLIMDLGHFTIDDAARWGTWLNAGYAAMQFVFAPVIGNLSDRFGRRPVLLACLLGFGADYAVMGAAPTLGWLILGRAIAGVTGASYSTAYAYIADITEPENRAASFGFMGMAFGFGFIFGPALGGFLGEFGPRIPFYAAGAFALVNFAFGFAVLRESLPADRRRPFRFARANAFSALRALAGQGPTVLWFVAALAVWQLSHTVYPSIWAYFAIAAYGWSQWQIGLSLTVVGVGSALVQGFGLKALIPRIGERGAVALGIATVVLVSVIYAFVRFDPAIYAALLFGGLQGLVQPSIAALNSRAVSADSQGQLQGATQAVASIAQIVGPLLYGQVFAAFAAPDAHPRLPGMPLLLSAGIALVALALFWRGARLLRG